VTIRLHAIRGLEMICKNNPSTVRRIAEMLGQLLVSDEKLELQCVKHTFTSLFTIDPQAAFLALFTLVSTGVDANLRAKGLEFLIAQLQALVPALRKNVDVAAGLHAGLKAMLAAGQNQVIEQKDLRFLLDTLIALSPHGPSAAKVRADEPLKAELANILATQAGLTGAGFDLSNEASLKYYFDVQGIASWLSGQYGVDTSAFVTFAFSTLLPNVELVASAEQRTRLLKSVASAASKITPKQAQTYFPAFWAQFKKFIPTGEIVAKAAPAAAAAAAASPAAASPVPSPSPEPDAAAASSATSLPAPASSINFAFAEVFLYLFHLLAAQAPTELRAATGIFTPTGQPTDFNVRTTDGVHLPSE
jgi:hypothetical protein